MTGASYTCPICSGHLGLTSAFGEQYALDLPPPSPHRSQPAEALTGREIADRLVLSVNTVKRHVYNICSKLVVQIQSRWGDFD